jgi:hypothetical protein
MDDFDLLKLLINFVNFILNVAFNSQPWVIESMESLLLLKSLLGQSAIDNRALYKVTTHCKEIEFDSDQITG